MMLKSVFLSVVLALAVCSQQTVAVGVDGSGQATSGDMKMTWSKTGDVLTLTAEAQTNGYMTFSFGSKVSRHGAKEAVSCDQAQCRPSSVTGAAAYSPPNAAYNLQCNGGATGGVVRATCTRTVTENDDNLPLGRIQSKMAVGPGSYDSTSRHSGTTGFASQEMVGPPPPVPPVPTPPAGAKGQCSQFRADLAAQGKQCGVNSSTVSCQNATCVSIECCQGGTVIDAVGGGGTTTPTPGMMTPTPGGNVGGALSPACSSLLAQYAANGLTCPGMQYPAYAQQCATPGQCSAFDCCMVPLTGAAGTVAPTVAAVLASVLAMLALLF